MKKDFRIGLWDISVLSVGGQALLVYEGDSTQATHNYEPSKADSLKLATVMSKQRRK